MPCGRVRLQYSHRFTRKNALDLILSTGNFNAERGFYPSARGNSSLAAGYMPSENVLCTGNIGRNTPNYPYGWTLAAAAGTRKIEYEPPASRYVVIVAVFHYDIEDFYVNDALGMVRAAKPATAGSE